MASEEQKVTLIVKRDNLPSLEFREWWKERLEHSPDAVSETRDKVVEHQLWVMGCCSCMALFSVSTLNKECLRIKD
jgi:hypothetical protein